jgi:hypothetical protein
MPAVSLQELEHRRDIAKVVLHGLRFEGDESSENFDWTNSTSIARLLVFEYMSWSDKDLNANLEQYYLRNAAKKMKRLLPNAKSISVEEVARAMDLLVNRLIAMPGFDPSSDEQLAFQLRPMSWASRRIQSLKRGN